MFAIASVVSFAVALILTLVESSVDFDFVILGLLLLACHHAFPGVAARRP